MFHETPNKFLQAVLFADRDQRERRPDAADASVVTISIPRRDARELRFHGSGGCRPDSSIAFRRVVQPPGVSMRRPGAAEDLGLG